MHVEGAIDFPEDEVDFLGDSALHGRMEHTLELCAAITAKARQGALLREGMTVVIAGRPNAGKSSLLNRLAGYDAAIVTEIPGTTRDVLRERIDIDGMPMHVADTAGLRDEADVVESEGIRRARAEMSRADRILYVVDATRALDDESLRLEAGELPADVPATWVFNKIDLAGSRSRIESTDPPRVYLSATTGEGIDLLRAHLKECMGYQGAEAGTVSARRRHLDALARAQDTSPKPPANSVNAARASSWPKNCGRRSSALPRSLASSLPTICWDGSSRIFVSESSEASHGVPGASRPARILFEMAGAV